jgi:hypothetical protein
MKVNNVISPEMFDIMERMESLVPEYSYSSVKEIAHTDKMVRDVVISELKQIKDYLFHVVQVSYELQRDKLSDAAEDAWEDIDILIDKVENSKTSKLKGNKSHCEECKARIEKHLHIIVRRDKEIVNAVKDMRKAVQIVYKSLLEKGKEGHFIKNLEEIKKYRAEIDTLLDEREKGLMGE